MSLRPPKEGLKRYLAQTLLSLLVLGAFLGNAMGLYDLSWTTGGDLDLRTLMLTQLAEARDVPAVAHAPQFQVLLAVGLALAVLLPLLSPIRASLLTFLAMLPVPYLELATPTRPTLLPMEYALVTIMVLFGVNVLAGYFAETRSKQRVISLFGQYAPAEVVELISRDPQGFTMDGEAREMTVLFCDIKDFTSIAEHLDPRQLVQMLNSVFDPLTDIMHKHLGTIDKYMGDAVMAFWGAPAEDPRHAHHAVSAALEIQGALRRLRAEFKLQGWPPVAMGTGVSTGVMNVGNMGSRYRVAYTVVGDAVNLAARLENLTRSLDTEIIVSESTMLAAPQVAFRELGTVRVKGKQKLVRVYEPVCLKSELSPELAARLQEHAEALETYYQRRWDQAVSRFGRLWEKDPEDRLYELYLKNIAQFTKGPRPPGWAGELEVL